MLRVSVCDNIHRKRALRHRGMTQISFAAFLSAASFGAALLTGCGLGTVDHSGPATTPVQGAVLQGRVHGGQQPVNGAKIELWAASSDGYGVNTSAALNASNPVYSGPDGGFSLNGTYSCPTGSGNDAQVYLTATGGNPGLTPPSGGSINNQALVLMTALGSCSALSSEQGSATYFINVNEVSTVASAYALAQFAAPNIGGTGIQIGTSSGNYTGLQNAMKTVNNLFDLGTGNALAITPSYAQQGGTPGGLLNSSYVPQARINTLANILATCVNTDGSVANGSVNGATSASACALLFAAATPQGGTAPTDTLQAILSIAQNPGSNAEAIFALLPGTGNPFGPVLSSPAPVDWTLALTYAGGGLGSASGVDPFYATAINDMAIDEQGNIWMAGSCRDSSGTVNGAVVELDNQGNAISPTVTASGDSCGGGYQPQFAGAPVLNIPQAIAIDLNNNVWVGGEVASISKLASDGTVAQANYPPAVTYNNNGGSYLSSGSVCGTGSQSPIFSMAVDASSNLWAACEDGSAGNEGAVSVISTIDGSSVGGFDSGFEGLPAHISLDLFGNAWSLTAWNASQAYTGDLYQINAGAGAAPNTDTYSLISSNSASGNTFVNSVVPDGAGNVYSVNVTPGALNALATSTGAITQLPYPLPAGAVGVQQLALDGNGNLWGAAYSGAAPAQGVACCANALVPSYLVEMNTNTSTGSPVVVSPAGTTSLGASIYGFTGTGGGGETQPILANAAARLAHNPATQIIGGIAIDGSGNLWVANGVTASPTFNKNPSAVPSGEQMVEFIGLAAPVRTPLAQGLVNGEVGVRPQVVHAGPRPVRATSIPK